MIGWICVKEGDSMKIQQFPKHVGKQLTSVFALHNAISLVRLRMNA